MLQVVALTGSLATAYVVFGVSGWVPATPATVEAAAIAGTVSLSGTVDSSTPFKAAQVFIRNVDKRILYMVYTNAGQLPSECCIPIWIRITTLGAYYLNGPPGYPFKPAVSERRTAQ